MRASPQKSKSVLTRWIAWLHLWPGLVSAIILIFVCLTGAVVVFGDEIIDYAAGEALYVPEVKRRRIPMEILLEKFKKDYPDRHAPSYFVTYKDPRRTVKFNSYDEKTGLSYVYMDPYTGKILKEDRTIYFFFITAHLHNSLLLGKPGQWIVDMATLIFVISLITGMVLWWPKRWNKHNIKRSFKIRWKARRKRLNYDLHNVLGFYALTVIFVLAVTGLIIAFPPLQKAASHMLGGKAPPSWEKKLPPDDSSRNMAPMDPVITRYYKQNPKVRAVQVITYFLDKQGYYVLHAASWVGLKNYVGQTFFVNKYTGKEMPIPGRVLIHEKIENAWWMLHMGTWMGIWGKIITFIAGLIATSLPITGFYIWWGKRKKRKPKKG